MIVVVTTRPTMNRMIDGTARRRKPVAVTSADPNTRASQIAIEATTESRRPNM